MKYLLIFFAILLISSPVSAAPQIPAPDKVTLLDLGSDCIPCELQDKIVRRIEKEFSDSIAVYYLDVETNPQYKQEYHIDIIPTLVFYNKKGEEVERKSGYMKEGAMRKLLQKLIAE